MRPLIFLFFIFIGQNSFGQYQIDSSVKKEFDSLFRQQKANNKKDYIRLFKTGVSFLTYLKEDTLNVMDIQPLFFDTTIIIDTRISPSITNTSYKKIWFECNGKFVADTFLISTHFGFLGGANLEVKIFQNKTFGTYSEYEKNWYQYKHTLSNSDSNFIQVNANVENLILSERPNINSKRIYGKAYLIAEPFYVLDETFKTGYVLKQIHINFIFSCDNDKGKQ